MQEGLSQLVHQIESAHKQKKQNDLKIHYYLLYWIFFIIIIIIVIL